MQGKKRQKKRPFGRKETAHILRLWSPCYYSNRIIITDSAISSVHNAVECLNHDFHFMGSLKLHDQASKYARGGDK